MSTRRTLNQALVAAVASSRGVNVYSPWTGEVVCDVSNLHEQGSAVRFRIALSKRM
jgi:hypothetical protein